MSKRTSPYERELDSILAALPAAGSVASGRRKPSLLLHACCAPCSSYVIEYLSRYFAITIYYYNPNIHPAQEYGRRRDELLDFLPRFLASTGTTPGIQVIEGRYDPEDFYRATGVREEPELQTEAEKGERCRRCYEFRMKAASQYAREHAFDWFTTTLSISPFKDAGKINAIGRALEQEGEDSAGGAPRFLPSDFKKKGGFKRSLELSAEYGLYRQDYCGCAYSRANKGSCPKSDRFQNPAQDRPLPKSPESC